MNDGNSQVLVLADDFTGASDAGVSLVEAGMSVEVTLSAGQLSAARALVLNSDGRAMSAAAAADKVAGLLRGVVRLAPHWQIKKIDFTLRGNLGGELEVMMVVHGCRLVVVVPAYPAVGWHTRDGRCYAHGVVLDQTEFASDSKTPVSRAEISETIAVQSRLPCLTLNTAQFPEALATVSEEKRVLTVDAWEDSHLDQATDAVAPHVRETLLAGLVELCEALARRLRRCEQGPLLALVGSMSEMTQRQVAALQAHSRVKKIEIDVEQALSRSSKEEASRIVEMLCEGHHCVVTTRLNNAARHGTEAQCNERGLSRATHGEHICVWLASITAQVVVLCPPGTLYLPGGDATIAAVRVLDATGSQTRGWVAQCVPYGHSFGGCWSQPVMTRAGGSDTDTTLLSVMNLIEKKLSA